jgi:alpha-aminoadipate/glutamate carrier protein LysW
MNPSSAVAGSLRCGKRLRSHDDLREVSDMAVCPECEADIEIDEYDVDKGEIISCPECGVDLEVVGLSPLELDLAPQEEDDWEE